MEGIYTLQSKKEISINLEKKTINYSKRGETKYYEGNHDIVFRVIDKELKYIRERVAYLEGRITQTETITTKIKNGVKITDPLTDTAKVKFRERLKELNTLIEYLVKTKEEIKNS